jgi:phytochrome B
MGGEVQYIRESERSFFLIVLEQPQPRPAAGREIVWYVKIRADPT